MIETSRFGVPAEWAFTTGELVPVLYKIVIRYYDHLLKWYKGEYRTYEKDGKKIFDPKMEYQPILLIGPPGCGKSMTVFSIAEQVSKTLSKIYDMKIKLDVIDLRISQLDPTDIKGLPMRPEKVRISIDEITRRFREIKRRLKGEEKPVPSEVEEEIVKWALPEFLPRKGLGILFLDEINLGAPSVLAACYQLILDRKVGKYELPPGWIVIAAMNPPEQAEIASPLPPPLINRFRTIYVIPERA